MTRRRDEGGWTLADCRSRTERFDALVADTADRVGVDARALTVRTLLHLPRVASASGRVNSWHLQREVRMSAERLRTDTRTAQMFVSDGAFSLGDLPFELIDPAVSDVIFRSLHYLRSARAGSLNFALVDPASGRPISLVSVSPLEWTRVRTQICGQFGILPERIWEISRMYSISAPANAISYLLGSVRAYLRVNHKDVELLTTAVDPNLGFTGASYRAANWKRWMTVMARPYLYEHGQYVTPRQLRERYGTSNPAALWSRYPGRFERSRVRLLDSLIYCCRINEDTEDVPLEARRRLHR